MNSSNLLNRSDKEMQVVARLKTVDECRQFSINQKGNIGMTNAAERRAVEIQVAAHSNETAVIQDIWSIVYSYESLLFSKHGKRFKANHTRRSIKNHGEVAAVERIVCQRHNDDDGFARLSEAGFHDKTFEALVLRHPEYFSETAIEKARTKIG